MRILPAEADRHISPLLAARGGVDPYLTEWVVSSVRPGDTVIDLGGHIGYYTLLLARQVGPTGRVLSFEPDPVNFTLLAENVALNGYRNVEVFPLAVGDRAGTVTLHRSSDNAGDHRIWQGDDEARAGVPVHVVSLDEFFGGRQLAVDLVKLDVQGAEPAAVRGMRRLLDRRRHLRLVTEFWPYGLSGAGCEPLQFLDLLASLGFRLHVIDEANRLLRLVRPEDATRMVATGPDDFLDLLCIRT
jgi:FkbM family methyltransferase